jgi:hypothetical protein
MRALKDVAARPRHEAASMLALGSALLGAGSVILALSCTRWGAGIGGDGVAYVAGARNLLHGLGFSWIGPGGDVRPITIFAPLFSALLSGLGLLGLDPLVGARWLNAALFCVNVVLVIRVLFRHTRETWLLLLSGILFVFSPVVLGLHTGAGSEPVFFTFLLLAVLAVARYVEAGTRGWVVLAAAAAAASYLARYAGLMVIAGGFLSVLLVGREPRKNRLLSALTYAGITGTVVVAWLLHNSILEGSSTSREFVFEPLAADIGRRLADLGSYWFLPDRVPLAIRVAVVGVGLILLSAAWAAVRRRARQGSEGPSRAPRGALTAIMVLMIAVYIAGVLLSRMLFVPRISLDQRILAPVHLLTILLILAMAHDICEAGRPLARGLVATGVLLLAVSYLGRGTIRALELQLDGQGFASQAWQTSPLVNALRLLPEDTPIYTNEVEALYLLAGRQAYRLPTGCLPEDALYTDLLGTECRTAEFLAWVERMRYALENRRAVVAVFNTYGEQPYYAPLVPEMVAGLDILTTQGDGRMYVYDRDQWPENPNW